MASQRQNTTLPTGPDLAQAITNHLASHGVSPKSTWLNELLRTARPNTPRHSLQQTALFRILSTDLTATVQTTASSSLPRGITDASITEQRLPGPITVQVLSVEDIGRSRWSQIEALEAVERGEGRRGQEVVRTLPEEGNAGEGRGSSGPHKLLVQDAAGTKVFALEIAAVRGVGVDMAIGAKLVLRQVVVARGVVLLEQQSVEVLGGKVEAWDVKWKEGRKAMLKETVGSSVES